MYVCMCIYCKLRIYIYTYIHTYIHTYIYKCPMTHSTASHHIHVYTYTRTYIAHIHTRTHTHTHTQASPFLAFSRGNGAIPPDWNAQFLAAHNQTSQPPPMMYVQQTAQPPPMPASTGNAFVYVHTCIHAYIMHTYIRRCIHSKLPSHLPCLLLQVMHVRTCVCVHACSRCMHSKHHWWRPASTGNAFIYVHTCIHAYIMHTYIRRCIHSKLPSHLPCLLLQVMHVRTCVCVHACSRCMHTYTRRCIHSTLPSHLLCLYACIHVCI